jgi:hypothetical protein
MTSERLRYLPLGPDDLMFRLRLDLGARGR